MSCKQRNCGMPNSRPRPFGPRSSRQLPEPTSLSQFTLASMLLANASQAALAAAEQGRRDLDPDNLRFHNAPANDAAEGRLTKREEFVTTISRLAMVDRRVDLPRHQSSTTFRATRSACSPRP